MLSLGVDLHRIISNYDRRRLPVVPRGRPRSSPPGTKEGGSPDRFVGVGELDPFQTRHFVSPFVSLVRKLALNAFNISAGSNKRCFYMFQQSVVQFLCRVVPVIFLPV